MKIMLAPCMANITALCLSICSKIPQDILIYWASKGTACQLLQPMAYEGIMWLASSLTAFDLLAGVTQCLFTSIDRGQPYVSAEQWFN